MILTVTLNAALDSTWVIKEFKTNHILRTGENIPVRMAGGKGINVARTINNLGEDVLTSGLIGGTTGKFIEEKLNEEGLKNEFIHVKEESRECLILLDQKNKTETVINGIGPKISFKEAEDFKNFFLKSITKFKVICLSGSLPPGLPENIYADLISMANKKNVPVILDTSAQALIKGIAGKPHMVKPTKYELEEILNHKIKSNDDILEAGNCFLDKGAESVIVSMGQEGSILFTKEYQLKIAPLDIKVINSVGSGDAFVGGFAVATARGSSLLDAVKFGTATGSANAEVLKAGEVNIERVKELSNNVELYPLN